MPLSIVDIMNFTNYFSVLSQDPQYPIKQRVVWILQLRNLFILSSINNLRLQRPTFFLTRFSFCFHSAGFVEYPEDAIAINQLL